MNSEQQNPRAKTEYKNENGVMQPVVLDIDAKSGKYIFFGYRKEVNFDKDELQALISLFNQLNGNKAEEK